MKLAPDAYSLLRLLLLAGTVFFSFPLSSAHAVDASGPGAAAVTAKWNSIPSSVKSAYFVSPAAGSLVPQWTPDGGVFQYFTGSYGLGAIYWSAATGAHLIRGAILQFFMANGFEVTQGYPTSDEFLSDPQNTWCLDDAVVEQGFGPAGIICWKPGDTWRATILG